MSKSEKPEFVLTGSGSVSFQDKDCKTTTYTKGTEITATQLKEVPARQRPFFKRIDEVGVEAADEHSGEPVMITSSQQFDRYQDAIDAIGTIDSVEQVKFFTHSEGRSEVQEAAKKRISALEAAAKKAAEDKKESGKSGSSE